MKLTKRAIDAAKPRERDYVLWDDEVRGFGCKITPTGGKIYLLKYRTRDGKARKPKIETHGNVTVDEARSVAKAWAAEVAHGGDPSADKKAARQASTTNDPAFHEVIDEFIEKYAKVRQRTWKETERVLRTNCAPWLNRPIHSISKTDAYSLLDGFIAEGKGHKARVTLAWLKTLWRWAWKREIVEQPIMDAVEIDFERNVRDRCYSDDELRSVWRSADKLLPLEAGFIKLVVLLGVRKNELAGMQWSELDDPDNPTLWTIPFERTKSRRRSKQRVYLVPLSPLARRIIKSLPRFEGDLVFPGRHKGKPMEPGKWLSSKVREAASVTDWTYHACRHSVATWLENHGHSEYERALVLNHSGGGSVTSGYSHGYPLELKHELMEKWADHIQGLVQPEGAVLLT